jgi:hypothetical protein
MGDFQQIGEKPESFALLLQHKDNLGNMIEAPETPENDSMLGVLTKTLSVLTAVALTLPPLAVGNCCCLAAHQEQRSCCRAPEQQSVANASAEESQPGCPHCRKREQVAKVSTPPQLTLANRDCRCVKNAPDRLLTENSPRPKLQHDISVEPVSAAAPQPTLAGARGRTMTSLERVRRPLFTLYCVCIV